MELSMSMTMRSSTSAPGSASTASWNSNAHTHNSNPQIHLPIRSPMDNSTVYTPSSAIPFYAAGVIPQPPPAPVNDPPSQQECKELIIYKNKLIKAYHFTAISTNPSHRVSEDEVYAVELMSARLLAQQNGCGPNNHPGIPGLTEATWKALLAEIHTKFDTAKWEFEMKEKLDAAIAEISLQIVENQNILSAKIDNINIFKSNQHALDNLDGTVNFSAVQKQVAKVNPDFNRLVQRIDRAQLVARLGYDNPSDAAEAFKTEEYGIGSTPSFGVFDGVSAPSLYVMNELSTSDIIWFRLFYGVNFGIIEADLETAQRRKFINWLCGLSDY